MTENDFCNDGTGEDACMQYLPFFMYQYVSVTVCLDFCENVKYSIAFSKTDGIIIPAVGI